MVREQRKEQKLIGLQIRGTFIHRVYPKSKMTYILVQLERLIEEYKDNFWYCYQIEQHGEFRQIRSLYTAWMRSYWTASRISQANTPTAHLTPILCSIGTGQRNGISLDYWMKLLHQMI